MQQAHPISLESQWSYGLAQGEGAFIAAGDQDGDSACPEIPHQFFQVTVKGIFAAWVITEGENMLHRPEGHGRSVIA